MAPSPIRARSREAILTAAALALAENPGASLQDVAVRAGVGRATLYRHFSTREDLIQELGMEAIRAVDVAVAHLDFSAMSAAEFLREMFVAVIPLGDRFHFLASEQSWSVDVRREYARQLHQLEELVDALRAEGALAADVPTAWAVHTMDMLIWTGWSAVHYGAVAPLDAPALAYRTFMNGLSTPA